MPFMTRIQQITYYPIILAVWGIAITVESEFWLFTENLSGDGLFFLMHTLHRAGTGYKMRT